MTFVRFVFAVLIAGMLVNLIIVLLGNSAGHQRLLDQTRREKEQFAQIVNAVDDAPRRLDIVVESQRISAGVHDTVTTTSVFVRQYQAIRTDQSRALPVERILIPGDRIEVGGVMIEFNSEFSLEDQDVQFLRGKTLLYFSRICGAGEKAPPPPLPDKRFTFLPIGQVPQLTRLDPRQDRPAYFEVRLWDRLWQLIPDIPPGANLPWASPWSRHGLRVTWFKPAEHQLRRGHTYTAYVTRDGVTIGEDRLPSIPTLLTDMLTAGQELLKDDDGRPALRP